MDKIDKILHSKETDGKIRKVLRDADQMGNLSMVAKIVGIAGGVESLREIMNSEEELGIMDRGMLGMHLRITP